MKVREHDVSAIIATLTTFGQTVLEGTNPQNYIICGNYLASAPYMLTNPRHLAKFIKNGQWGDRIIQLPFSANYIQIKNNMRIFGCGKDRKQTAKIALGGVMRQASLHREIKVRNALSGKTGLSFKIPRLHKWDRTGHLWLLEEEIQAIQKQKKLAEEFIKDHAFRFYASTTTHRQISAYKTLKTEAGELTAQFPEIKHLMNKTWPVACGHGDLSGGNMIKDKDNNLYVLDWELSRILPVACDLRAIYKNTPGLRADILQRITSLSQNPTDTTAKNQMALALAYESIDVGKHQEKYISYHKNVSAMTAQEARHHIDTILKTNKNMIRELIA